MTTTSEPPPFPLPRRRRRALRRTGASGSPSASALYIAAVLGTGILVLPGLAADAAGPASMLAVAAVLLLSIPLAGTFAALAARYPGCRAASRRSCASRSARPPPARPATGSSSASAFGAPVVASLGGEYLVAALGARPRRSCP